MEWLCCFIVILEESEIVNVGVGVVTTRFLKGCQKFVSKSEFTMIFD